MRALVQRVIQATVDVIENGTNTGIGRIGKGLCVVLGVTHDDTAAARPDQAEPHDLVDGVVSRWRDLGATVATGRFRASMRVSLVNDGPVTVMVER